jgi:hypothetical protein
MEDLLLRLLEGVLRAGARWRMSGHQVSLAGVVPGVVPGLPACDNERMNTTLPPKGQIAELGQRYYEANLAKLLEPQHNGKYLVLDVDTGDYEVDAENMAAYDRLAARHPGKIFYATRVGYGVLFSLGGRIRVRQ